MTMMDVCEAKTRRRPAVRTATPKAAQKVKVTLCLEEDAAKRLAVYAAMVGQERSSVVGELIREHLRRFRVQDLDQPRTRPASEALPVSEIGSDPTGD